MYQNSTDRPAGDSTAPTVDAARILVVGVGALGCPAARLLAESSEAVATLTLVDADRIELSNLQRQPLFTEADIGELKAEVAASKLTAAYDGRVQAVPQRLDADNAERLIASHDYVIDATDCPQTKFLINDTASRLGVPFSYAGVLRTGGQAMAVLPGESACLRCVFPDVLESEDAGACSDMGILAPVAGVIGSLQAAHALGHISGRPFERGCMTIYNLRGQRIRRVAFKRRDRCTGCSRRGEQQGTEKPSNSLAPSSAPPRPLPGAERAAAGPRS